MKSETVTDSDWLERMFRKSESDRTQTVAFTSLKLFDYFCQSQRVSKEEMIKKYQDWFEQTKPDIRSICMSLDKFVQFMNKDQNKSLMGAASKKKSPKSIRLYFGFIKSYLRIAHGVRLSVEDIQDYIQFPKPRKEQRRPLSLKQLREIMNNASPQRKALYYVLVSSGLRLGEALTLTKRNFHFNENPVRVTLEAENTKTKEGRETYISSEAVEKLKPLLEGLNDHQPIFTKHDKLNLAVSYEDKIFSYLREKLGMTERYPNSIRFVVNIHSMRAYFHTKASQKHGSDYANALDGHGAYLKQYYREDPKERAKKYSELEPSLFIETQVNEAYEERKDKEIADLQETVKQMQKDMQRMELPGLVSR